MTAIQTISAFVVGRVLSTTVDVVALVPPLPYAVAVKGCGLKFNRFA